MSTAGTADLTAQVYAYKNGESSATIRQGYTIKSTIHSVETVASSKITKVELTPKYLRENDTDVDSGVGRLFLGDERTPMTVSVTGSDLNLLGTDEAASASKNLLSATFTFDDSIVKVYPEATGGTALTSGTAETSLTFAESTTRAGVYETTVYLDPVAAATSTTVTAKVGLVVSNNTSSSANNNVEVGAVSPVVLEVVGNPIGASGVTTGNVTSNELVVAGDGKTVKASVTLDSAYVYGTDVDKIRVYWDSTTLGKGTERADKSIKFSGEDGDEEIEDDFSLQYTDAVYNSASGKYEAEITAEGQKMGSGKHIQATAQAFLGSDKIGHSVSASNSAAITVKQSYLYSLDSVTVTPPANAKTENTVYVGGDNPATVTAVISGAAPSGDDMTLIDGTNKVGIAWTQTAKTGSGAVKFVTGSYAKTYNSNPVSFATYDAKNKVWKATIQISGTHTGTASLGVSAQVVAASNGQPIAGGDGSSTGVSNTAVDNTGADDNSDTNPIITIASNISIAIDNEAEITSNLVAGGVKEMNSTITAENYVENNTSEWNAVRLEYAWSGTAGDIKFSTKADEDFANTITTYVAKTAFKSGTKWTAPANIYVKGLTANSSGNITVTATLLKGYSVDDEGVITEGKAIANSAVSDTITGLTVGKMLEKVSISPAAGAVYVGDTVNMVLNLKSNAGSGVNHVKVRWKYPDGVTNANKIFGELSDEYVKAEGEAGAGYISTIPLTVQKVSGTGTTLVADVLAYSSKTESEETQLDGHGLQASDLTSPTYTSAGALNQVELDYSSTAIQVGGTKTITAEVTPNANTDKLGKVEIVWPADTNYYTVSATGAKKATSGTYNGRLISEATKTTKNGETIYTAQATAKGIQATGNTLANKKFEVYAIAYDNPSSGEMAALVEDTDNNTYIQSSDTTGVMNITANAISGLKVETGDSTPVTLIDQTTPSNVASSYPLWINNTATTLKTTMADWNDTAIASDDIAMVRTVWTFDKEEGANGAVEFSKDGTTGWTSEGITVDTTERGTGNNWQNNIYIRAKGEAAVGRIKTVTTAYTNSSAASGTSRGVEISETTCKINVQANPIGAGSGLVMVPSTKQIALDGGTATVEWEILSPYDPATAKNPIDHINVVFSDQSGTGRLSFPDLTANTLKIEANKYDGKGYHVSTRVKLTGAAAFSAGSIKAEATAYSSVNDTASMGYKVDSTITGITGAASTTTIKGVKVAFGTNGYGANSGLMTLGTTVGTGDVASTEKGRVKMTATIESSTQLSTSTAMVGLTWKGDAGTVSLSDTQGNPINLVDGEYPVHITTTGGSTGAYTGTATIYLTGTGVGAGYFEARAYVTGTGASAAGQATSQSGAIKVQNYIKSVNVAYSGSATDNVINYTTADTFNVVATVTPTETTNNGINGLYVKWTWNGTSGAIDTSENTKDMITTSTEALAGGVYRITGTFKANEAFDLKTGTMSASVQASSSSSDVAGYLKGKAVSATTKDRIVIATNALKSVTLENTSTYPNKEIYVGSDDENSNLKATVAASDGISDITKVKITWTYTGSVSGMSITTNDSSETDGSGNLVTIINWANNNKYNEALIKSATNPYNGKITVSAQAYHKNAEGVEVKYGKAVTIVDPLEVKVYKQRELAFASDTSGETEITSADVVNGFDFKLDKTSGSTSNVYVKSQGTPAKLTYTSDSSYLAKNETSSTGTVGAFTAQNATTKRTANITVSSEIDDTNGYFADTATLPVTIWPEITSGDISMDKTSGSLKNKESLELTVSGLNGKEINPDYVSWSVVEAGSTTVRYTLKESTGLKNKITIDSNNATDGTITVRATVNGQLGKTAQAGSAYFNCPIEVKSLIEKIKVNTTGAYDTGKTVKVNREVEWGPQTVGGTGDKPIVFTNAVDESKVSYTVDYADENKDIARVTPKVVDGVYTGGFVVKGLKVGTTTVLITASKEGVSSNTVGITLEVEKDELNFRLNPENVNTYVGGTIDLTNTNLIKRNITLSDGTAITGTPAYAYLYEDDDNEGIVSIDSKNMLKAEKAGTAKVTVVASLAGYEDAKATLNVKVLETLSTVSIVPGTYYLKNSTSAGNIVKLGLDTNLSSLTGSNYSMTYGWEKDNTTNINWTNDTTATPTVSVSSPFASGTTNNRVNISISLKQDFTGVVGATSTNDTYSITKTAQMTLFVTDNVVSFGEVNLNKTAMTMYTGSSAKTLTTSLTSGQAGIEYTWDVYTSKGSTTKDNSVITVTPSSAVGADTTTEAIPVGKTAQIAVKDHSLTAPKTVVVRVTATQKDGSTIVNTDTEECEVTVYPAAKTPVIFAVDPSDTKAIPTQYGDDEKLKAGKTYDIKWTYDGNDGKVPAGYEFTKTETINDKTTGGEVIDDTSKMTISGISTAKGSEGMNGTVEAKLATNLGTTVAYTLALKDEDDEVLWTTTGSTTFKVEDEALTKVSIDRGTNIAMSEADQITFTAEKFPAGASNVTYEWMVQYSDDSGSTWNGSGVENSYLKIVGPNTGSSVKVLAKNGTDSTYMARVVVEGKQSGDSLDTPVTAACVVTVESTNVPVTRITGIAADGQTSGTNYLDVNSTEGMELEVKYSPSNAQTTWSWYINDTEIADVKAGTDRTGSKITIVPTGKKTGRINVMAIPSNASNSTVIGSTTVWVQEVSLEGVAIRIQGFEDKSVSSDSISVGGKTTLVAVPVPKTAELGSVVWEIDETSKTNVGAITKKDNGTSTTITGIYGDTNGLTKTVKATAYDADGNKVGTPDTFNINVYTETVPITNIYLDKTSEKVLVGGTTSVTATYLPTGASAEDIIWSTYSGNESTIDITSTEVRGKSSVANIKAVAGGSDNIIAYADNDNSGDFDDSYDVYDIAPIDVQAISAQSIAIQKITDGATDYEVSTDAKTGAKFVIVPSRTRLTITAQGIYQGTTPASDDRVGWTVTGVSSGATPTITHTKDENGKEIAAVITTPSTNGVTVYLQAQAEFNSGMTENLELVVEPTLSKNDKTNVEATVEIADVVYNGSEQKQPIVVKYRGQELKAGTDFDLEYTGDTTNAGEVAVKVVERSGSRFKVDTNYPIEAKYNITKASVAGMTPVLSATGFTYNTKVQKPGIKSITGAIGAMKEGTDYTVVYSNANSTNAGSYNVSIAAAGKNFTGTSKTAAYSIAKANTAQTTSNKAVTIVGVNSATRKGAGANLTGFTYKSSKPAVATVDANGKVVGKTVGSTVITVSAKAVNANYNAPKNVTYTVKVTKTKKPTIKKPSTKKKTVTAKWAKVSGASGYIVQIATKSNFKKGRKTVTIKKASTTSYKFRKLIKGRKYYIRVYAYVGNTKAANKSAASAKKSITCK